MKTFIVILTLLLSCLGTLRAEDAKISPIKYLRIEDEPVRKTAWNSSIGCVTEEYRYIVLGKRFGIQRTSQREVAILLGLESTGFANLLNDIPKKTSDLKTIALVLLSYLGNGNTLRHGERRIVRSGVNALVGIQSNSGAFSINDEFDLETHILCTCVYLEINAYGGKINYISNRNTANAIKYCLDNIDNGNLFKIHRGPGDKDLNINLWGLYALYCLKSAKRKIDVSYYDTARKWVKALDDEKGALALTAKLLGKIIVGPRNSASIDKSLIAKFFAQIGSLSTQKAGNIKTLYWATITLYQLRDDAKARVLAEKAMNILFKNNVKKWEWIGKNSIDDTCYAIQAMEFDRKLRKIIIFQ